MEIPLTYQERTKRQSKHIEQLEREKYKLINEKSEMEYQLSLKSTELRRMEEKVNIVSSNKKSLENKLHRLKEVMEARHESLLSIISSLVHVGDSFKAKFVKALEFIRKGNENISLLIETSYNELESIINERVDISRELNPKYRRYLDPKLVSTIDNFSANFSSLVSINALNNTQIKLIRELRGRRYIDENEASMLFGISSTQRDTPNKAYRTSTSNQLDVNMISKFDTSSPNITSARDRLMTNYQETTPSNLVTSQVFSYEGDDSIDSSMIVDSDQINNSGSKLSSDIEAMVQILGKLKSVFIEKREKDSSHIDATSLTLITENIGEIINHIEKICKRGNQGLSIQTSSNCQPSNLTKKIDSLKKELKSVEKRLESLDKCIKEETVNFDSILTLNNTKKRLLGITKESAELLFFETGGSSINNIIEAEIKSLVMKIDSQKERLSNQRTSCSSKSEEIKLLYSEYLQNEMIVDSLRLEQASLELNLKRVRLLVQESTEEIEKRGIAKQQSISMLEIESNRLKEMQNKTKELYQEIEREKKDIDKIRSRVHDSKKMLLDAYKEVLTQKDIKEEEDIMIKQIHQRKAELTKIYSIKEE